VAGRPEGWRTAKDGKLEAYPTVGKLEACPTGNEKVFAELMELCWRRCDEAGKTLVIRDWSHLDFMGVPFVRPSYRLTTAECLQGRFELLQVATVRHPVDQLLSLSKLAVVQGKIVVPEFLEGYRRFAEQAARIGFLRYEDFLDNPDAVLARLCGQLQIAFDSTCEQR